MHSPAAYKAISHAGYDARLPTGGFGVNKLDFDSKQFIIIAEEDGKNE